MKDDGVEWPKYRIGQPIVDKVLTYWICDMDMAGKYKAFDMLRWCPDVQKALDVFSRGFSSEAIVLKELDKALATARESLNILCNKYLRD